MAEQTAISLAKLIDERENLENQMQTAGSVAEQERLTARAKRLQREFLTLFRDTSAEGERIDVLLELVRLLEARVLYGQSLTFDRDGEAPLGRRLRDFVSDLRSSETSKLSPLEATYFDSICALVAGETNDAIEGFRRVCESEESDEANDVKYKSYVVLGNLLHAQSSFGEAGDAHDRARGYSQHSNVAAQALAFRGLNAFALNQYDEALSLFEQSLELFQSDQPFFNSYFHRNALLFCAVIHFDRKEFARAETYYEAVLQEVEQSSYDYFDALSHLGRIAYLTGRYDQAAERFGQAVSHHHSAENEFLVDTWYWLARTHLKRSRPGDARTYLERIAASDVSYSHRPQAMQLLERCSPA
jgi:tetratricopeptide (TPR) repeat protein